MPVDLQVIAANEFVRLGADEHLDFAATRQTLEALARACWKRGVNCALIDLRELPELEKPHFTPTQLAALVGAFRAAGFARKQRLAILYRHDVHRGIRSFAFIGRLRGIQVQAFTDFEGATNWLAEAAPGETTSQQKGDTVRISKAGTKPGKQAGPNRSSRSPD